MSTLAGSLLEAYKWLTPYEMILCAINLIFIRMVRLSGLPSKPMDRLCADCGLIDFRLELA